MKVTWSIKDTLIKEARKDLDAAQVEFNRAEQKLNDAQAVYDWAQGLVLSTDLIMKPDFKPQQPSAPFNPRKLYYVPSKTGRRYGHYIEVLTNSITCSCPGFRNRGYCWATREVQSGVGVYKYLWLKNVRDFDFNREAARNYD